MSESLVIRADLPPPQPCLLVTFPVAFLLVLFHHRPGGHFLGSPAVATRPLGTLLDVLVLALLLASNASQMFLPGHDTPPSQLFPLRAVLLQIFILYSEPEYRGESLSERISECQRC
jgi:hypothetical protein